MYFVYLKKTQIFQEMPQADYAVLPKESPRQCGNAIAL